jgi:Meiotically up-regulated gene 113
MRVYLRGPRILGVGTGISFGPEDFKSRNSRASSNGSGGSFLYVITGDHERVKVGVSIDSNRRRAELQTGSPFPLRIAYVAVTPGTGYDIEVEAKRTLDRYRCQDGSGDEWFNVPVEMAVAALNAGAFKRGQPLAQLTQEQLDATLRIAALPPDQVQAYLAKVGISAPAPSKPSKFWSGASLAAVTAAALAALIIMCESKAPPELIGGTFVVYMIYLFASVAVLLWRQWNRFWQAA